MRRYPQVIAIGALCGACCFGGAGGPNPFASPEAAPAVAPAMQPLAPSEQGTSTAQEVMPVQAQVPSDVPRGPARPLAAITAGYQPNDAADRFLWITSSDESGTRVQLHCDEHAVEAARRAVGRFRPRNSVCTAEECHLESAGNSDPVLFAANVDGGGVRLIAYWNGMAGDADRARIQEWNLQLTCGQIVSF